MGRYAGVVFIFTQIGQMANAIFTPLTFTQWGMQITFFIGFAACLISSVACFLLYFFEKK